MKNTFTFIKKWSLLFFAIITLQILAQVPQKMTYQAVIRNSTNNLAVNTNIGMRISILVGSTTGASVYTETQNTTTNSNGLATIEIGTGIVVTGNFSTIDWGGNSHYIKIETDLAGGNNYTITSISQLLSVPYSFYAENVKTSPRKCLTTSECGPGYICSGGYCIPSLPSGTNVGDMQYWNGTSWTMIPVGVPGQYLQLNSSSVPNWTGGTFASLTTASIPNQSYFSSSVNCSGTITNDGNNVILETGFCWNTSTNPTIFNNKIVSFNSTNFSSTINNLLPNTTYYVKAYVRSTSGTSYGNEVSFSTYNASLPTVTTNSVTSITGGTANSGGNITNDGGAAITARGICWSTSPNPTIADNKSISGIGTGAFSAIANAMLTNTTYHIRAYATNIAGTSYGSDITFTTLSTLSLGGFYQGGVLAYFLQPGDPGYDSTTPHGIIISKNVIGIANFGCMNVNYPNSFSQALGGGIANTLNIVSVCNDNTTAAVICDTLSLNGYADWYLPTTGDWSAVNNNYLLLNLEPSQYFLTSNVYGSIGGYNFSLYVPGNSGFAGGLGNFNFYAFRMF